MVKKLVPRSTFARLAGVSPTAVTKACKEGGQLFGALDGKSIDVDHPDAVAYMAAHDPKRPHVQPEKVEGIDPLYEHALAFARANGGMSIRKLKAEFSIGTKRAERLAGLLRTAGVLDKPQPEKTVRFKNVTLSMNPDGMEVRPRDYDADAPDYSPDPDEPVDLPGPSEWPGEQIEDIANLTLRELVSRFGTAERFKVWLQGRKMLVDIGAKEIANAERRGQLIPRDFVKQHVLGNYDRVHINLMTDGAQNIARRLVAQFKAGASIEECEQFVSDQVSRHIREAKDSILRALKNV